MSTTNGTTWDSINLGLTDKTVMALALSGPYLFAGTLTGVWRRPLSELLTAIEPDAKTMDHDFLLAQNYPDPFNPTTTIRYALPHRSHVTLTVYNTLGQTVATLVNGEIDAGYHSVEFNASNLASGVYYYRLQAESFVQTRKLLLIRRRSVDVRT